MPHTNPNKLPMHLFYLDSDSGVSLQQQIRQQIAAAIMNGGISQDIPLPSSRKLAEMLQVSRNTVILAYEHLLDDGYIVSRERSGYYANPNMLNWQISNDSSITEIESASIDWQHSLNDIPSRLHHIVKPPYWQKYEYPFIYGQFDAVNFPALHWRECSRDSVAGSAIKIWANDSLADDPLLIEHIQTHILPRRGVWCNPEQILITLGAQQGIYLLIKLLIGDRGMLGIENPGYTDVRNIAEVNYSDVRLLPVDEKGLRVGNHLIGCDCLYTTPSHQFPTTVTMPLDRRKQLVRMASEHNFFIIEDDYESEANFRSNPTPALKSMDQSGRVIYVGSFSKTLAPGLRMGFIVAPEPLIHEARALRRLMLRNVPQNNQRALALFISRGHFNTLIQKQNKIYQERWKVMGEALHDYLPESSQPPTFGGTSYWVKGPDHIESEELARLALSKGIIIEPGSIYFGEQSPPRNYFKLGYSSIPTEKIRPGIKKLSQIILEQG